MQKCLRAHKKRFTMTTSLLRTFVHNILAGSIVPCLACVCLFYSKRFGRKDFQIFRRYGYDGTKDMVAKNDKANECRASRSKEPATEADGERNGSDSGCD